MTVFFYAPTGPENEWVHEETSHKCPACGRLLSLVPPSTMLVCIKEHGPYFLVKD